MKHILTDRTRMRKIIRKYKIRIEIVIKLSYVYIKLLLNNKKVKGVIIYAHQTQNYLRALRLPNLTLYQLLIIKPRDNGRIKVQMISGVI